MGTLFDLSNKVALITGSTKGIGKAIAEQFALMGAKVVISSRNADACERVAAEINEQTAESSATPIPCNISEKSALTALVAQTKSLVGEIDILVCNAAVNPFYGSLADIPDSAFEKVLDVNVRSNHWLCQLVLPDMVARQSGSIIIVSSIAALKGSNVLGAYGLSKAADVALVKNLAVEYGPDNIRVNAILPGLIRTDFAKALWENPDVLRQRTAGEPLRRIGEPIEIAGAAVFLAADAASFMTGQTIVIDGGATIA